MTNAISKALLLLVRVAAGAAVVAGAATSALAQPAPAGMPWGPGMPGSPGMHGMQGGPGMMREGGGMLGQGLGMHGGGHRMEGMLAMVGATTEQRAKVHEIMKAAQQDLRKQHEANRGLRQQMAQLMATAKVDTAAVEATRQRLLASHDAVSKRMTQAMLDAGAVLTPEQRERIGARMAMLERHRKEREAMDPQRRN